MTAMALFDGYTPLSGAIDEFVDEKGDLRPTLSLVARRLTELGSEALSLRQNLVETAFLQGGVTFLVYSDEQGAERIFPFDIVPRVIGAAEWRKVEDGLVQRVRALNAFILDAYHERRIFAEGRVPESLLEHCSGYLARCEGLTPPGGVPINIAGIDLLRDEDGEFVVLEDNMRVPSGVSYVLENRAMMKRMLPRLFREVAVEPVDTYPMNLKRALREVAPLEGRVVVLTPGPFNSAYFEHSYLARRMGCLLVQGSDLFVHDDRVFVKTISGSEPVSTIYRRIDDAFLDPECFNPESLLGVRGLMRAYAKGNVAICNAPGNGIADDKATYPFVPEMIRFYLSEEPILGQVPTLVCAREEDRKEVLSNLERMVVKAVDGAGGYGMLVGPTASRVQIEEFRALLKEQPHRYVAQRVVDFSTCPIWQDGRLAPRRVDLRPFVVTGKSSWVLPGGLTRVALVEGSYVVNSSQGGGSKDTWVLRP